MTTTASSTVEISARYASRPAVSAYSRTRHKTQYWHFCHVFTHDPVALSAILWIFVLAFNLMQLFVYRQLRGYGRAATDVTRTILSLIAEMNDDRARLTEPIPWGAWDTS